MVYDIGLRKYVYLLLIYLIKRLLQIVVVVLLNFAKLVMYKYIHKLIYIMLVRYLLNIEYCEVVSKFSHLKFNGAGESKASRSNSVTLVAPGILFCLFVRCGIFPHRHHFQFRVILQLASLVPTFIII